MNFENLHFVHFDSARGTYELEFRTDEGIDFIEVSASNHPEAATDENYFDKKEVVDNIIMNTDIREWYSEVYSTDELKDYINEGVTFHELKEVISQGGDIYWLIGVGDSLIRERLFYGLATFENVEVGKIYDLWDRGNMLKNR